MAVAWSVTGLHPDGVPQLSHETLFDRSPSLNLLTVYLEAGLVFSAQHSCSSSQRQQTFLENR